MIALVKVQDVEATPRKDSKFRMARPDPDRVIAEQRPGQGAIAGLAGLETPVDQISGRVLLAICLSRLDG